jgi:hypothetical protein
MFAALVRLRAGVTSIGRSIQNDIVFDDDSISRRHAHLEHDGGDCFIVDDGSANGTYCNDDPVRLTERRQLRAGDRVTFGSTTVVRFLSGTDVEVKYHEELRRLSSTPVKGDVPDAAPSGSRDTMGRRKPEELPYVIASALVIWPTRRTSFGRAKALLDGIERALRYVVAIEIGVLRDDPDESKLQALARCIADAGIGDRPLSMGSWKKLATTLASLLPARDPWSAITHGFKRLSANAASLGPAVARAVEIRNAVAHGPGASEDAYTAEEQYLVGVLDAILDGLAPVWRLRLVSVMELEAVGEDESFDYALHEHRGATEYFPVLRMTVPHRLQNGICYLLPEAPSAPPISLAPLFFSQVCMACRRVEIAVADGLMLGPTGAQVRAHGLTTNHPLPVELPASKRLEALFTAVSALAAGERRKGGPS